MKTIDDIDMECTTPIFLSKTDELLQHLQNLSYTDLKSYLKCSDSIAKNTFEQFQNMDLDNTRHFIVFWYPVPIYGTPCIYG